MKIFQPGSVLPVEQLTARKAADHRSIAVIIPARNEAATIGTIVAAAHRELIRRHPLLDEIVVIDGNSTDDTAGIARQAGAAVYSTDSILPAADSFPQGKGAAIWKGLFVTSADILVFVDADISGFDPGYISKLAAPLLTDSTISLVKAAYTRPLVLGNARFENYGGRVTEILVRPFLSTFYPEIASLRQPLSGECAVRREIIESLPLRSGYGFDISLLLGVYERCGIRGIAQADLGTRCHRNRPVNELGGMAFQILHTLLAGLERKGLLSLAAGLSTAMQTPTGDGGETVPLQEVLLPPAHDLKLTS